MIPRYSKIWQCVKTLYPCSSPQNSWDLWMCIPLKMVSIGIDPYPYFKASKPSHFVTPSSFPQHRGCLQWDTMPATGGPMVKENPHGQSQWSTGAKWLWAPWKGDSNPRWIAQRLIQLHPIISRTCDIVLAGLGQPWPRKRCGPSCHCLEPRNDWMAL